MVRDDGQVEIKLVRDTRAMAAARRFRFPPDKHAD
jgi:hypothetical protein